MATAMAKKRERFNKDDLVVRAQTDVEALGQLYDLFYERIFRFCVYRIRDKQTAEDITSTVFLDVARKMHIFKGRTEQDFSSWLYAIAVNKANSFLRKTCRRNELLAQAADALSSSNHVDDHLPLDWPVLYRAILMLKPEHQTILTLRFFENMEYDQIGHIVHMRPGTVRVTLHRLLKKLRQHLQLGDKADA